MTKILISYISTLTTSFINSGCILYPFKSTCLNIEKVSWSTKENINNVYSAMGKKKFYRNPSENKSKIFRRSIFVVKNIKRGEKLTKKNIRRIRPGYGLEPKFFDKVLGKKTKKNLYAGNPLKIQQIK